MSVLDRFRLDGQRALVTGASRGLGRVMALALADAGADVVITGRTQETLDATAAEIGQRGRKAWTYRSDMAKPDECQATCERILRGARPDRHRHQQCRQSRDRPADRGGDAGDLVRDDRPEPHQLLPRHPAVRCGDDRARQRRPYHQHLLDQRAHREPRHRGADYETAKAAVLHFTRCAAADWARHGITVNAICPGLFMTDENKAWNERRPDVIDNIVKNIPVGRPGDPDEIGPLALYLASPAASYVTGAAYVIDGGYTLW